MKAKKFVLRKEFTGVPQSSDVEIVEEELLPLKDGEYLAEALYISVDPYMRSFKQAVGDVIIGQQVARIIESKANNYPVGNYVLGTFGWRTHTIATDKPQNKEGFREGIIKDMGDLPISLALGVLGMPGNTAYFGFTNVCKPRSEETVVVSGAGGAVGSHVGQIAKIYGCKVVGIVGNDFKGKWITEELGFDHYVNYKNLNFEEELYKCIPSGIDCYFDNVGGYISSIVLSKMNPFGRICACGYISQYNFKSSEVIKVPAVEKYFVSNHLQMEGFTIFKYLSQWETSFNQNLQWIKEGKLKYRETITEGFANTFNAFVNMLQGNNIGKAIVKI